MRLEELKQYIENGELIENAPMSAYTSFKAGGCADVLVLPADENELMATLSYCAKSGKDYMVMGNGSNILVKDGGYKGVIIKFDKCCNYIEGEGPEFEVGAAVSLASFAKLACSKGYAGFEFASGIPGSMGGAAFMNAGAYGGEMKDIITSVRLAKRDGSGKYELTLAEMDYGYRHSVLYDSGDIVLSVKLKLQADDVAEISKRMNELNQRRNLKQPLNYPSAGSFFKRPEGYFAGKLIEDAGMKGFSVGGAQVSEKHSGFVINKGGATATDILKLMKKVQESVYNKFGVRLEPEVRIIGED